MGGGRTSVSWEKIWLFLKNFLKEIDKYCLLCSKSAFPKSSISHTSSFHVWLADTAFPYEWFTPFQWFIFNKHQYVPWGNLFSRQYWNYIFIYLILMHYIVYLWADIFQAFYWMEWTRHKNGFWVSFHSKVIQKMQRLNCISYWGFFLASILYMTMCDCILFNIIAYIAA